MGVSLHSVPEGCVFALCCCFSLAFPYFADAMFIVNEFKKETIESILFTVLTTNQVLKQYIE